MKKSNSLKVMTFFFGFISLRQTELHPNIFWALAAMYQEIGGIRILEVIRWGMAEKRFRNTALASTLASSFSI